MEQCSCSGICNVNRTRFSTMKEKEFLNIIKNTINSDYIGDDCAYIKDHGIVVTQDNLAENIHFSLEYTTPYKLGYKSAMVNISDIAASGAKPEYITVGLSLPKNTDDKFVEEFYKGIKDTGIQVIGGDITGSDKIFISITAIGSTKDRTISSRKNAKIGYKVITTGFHGSSAAGLKQLQNGIKSGKFVDAHLMPKARTGVSKYIAENINTNYAMMDTSDGLADALMQISEQSGVSIQLDNIPYDKDIEQFENYMDLVLYGGEDYELVACVPEDFEVPNTYTIGKVVQGSGVMYKGQKITSEKIFNHFCL